MRLRPFVFAPLALAATLAAQPPLNRPVPLLDLPAAPSAGENALSLEAARRAQELGFPALAANFYRDLLAAPGGARAELTLALATALLDNNQAAEADRVLRSGPGPRNSPWHLRAGLAAAAERKFDQARTELAVVRLEDLSPADRAWYYYLEGATAPAGDLRAAGDAYDRARRAATTELQRARFGLAQKQADLRSGPAAPDAVEFARQNMEKYRGQPIGHEFARSYAVMLAGLGRRNDAIAVLERELRAFQPNERGGADDCRLLIGLIDGAAGGQGRAALMQLLEAGPSLGAVPGAEALERQRVGLQLLARASVAGPERAAFRAELDRLIAAPTPHPILEDLLLFRAAWALGNQPQEFQRAEDDANALLAKFPGSNLKAYAWGVLTASAWDQRRYRRAADDAVAEQGETRPGEARRELAVLRAEASFRAGTLAGDASDFHNAADAYAAALRDRPASIPAGELMFQQVEAEIESAATESEPSQALRSLAAAERMLDGMVPDPAFKPEQRWQAEVNLARQLKIARQTDVAYRRVSRLLQAAGGSEPLKPELRARMAWLQADLSLDAGEYARTLELVGALRRDGAGLPASLWDNIKSSGALLEAQADFALGREAAGQAVLGKLRADFPKSDDAVESYLIAAGHYAQLDQLPTAGNLYITLAENFPDSAYAPMAYYDAALLAEKLGQPANLQDATQLLERLVTRYPHHDLVFYARLKEGDLLSTLNEYPQAQQTYERVRYEFPQHKDLDYDLLALAECHAAQADSDPTHTESARTLLEDLFDRVNAPVNVRVEAGFSLGNLHESHGDLAQAQKTWWRVVTAFLLNPPAGSAPLDRLGRYWITRTLNELGTLDQREGNLEQAKQAWRLIIDSKLPGEKTARDNLASLDAAAPRP